MLNHCLQYLLYVGFLWVSSMVSGSFLYAFCVSSIPILRPFCMQNIELLYVLHTEYIQHAYTRLRETPINLPFQGASPPSSKTQGVALGYNYSGFQPFIHHPPQPCRVDQNPSGREPSIVYL